MNHLDVIHSDPEILYGKPIIRGTRIAVDLVLKKLSEGMKNADLIDAYPGLTVSHIQACLSYSAAVISREEIIAS